LLRYPYAVRSEEEYFEEIQDVKVTKDMLDLAKHFVNSKSGQFEPEQFEDHYETALIDLINQKRAGKTIRPKERPKGENVVDLIEALRRSVGGAKSTDPIDPEEACKKVEGLIRSEGDADADRRKEAGEENSGEETSGQTASEVGLEKSRDGFSCLDHRRH
jgi:hypothetical protein